MKKIIMIIIVILILYLAYELGVFFYKYNHLPTLPAIDQADKTFGQGPMLRYIAAGDSTSVGVGASNTENSYAYKIARALAKNNTVEYKNIGVIGFKTADVLEKQVADIIKYNPNIVTISMSGNDVTHLVASKKVLENYKNIISKLEQETTAKIYITTIPNFNGASVLPWFYIKLIEFRSKSQNQTILGLADDRVKIVNIHDFGWDQPPYKDRSKTYSADHFHPNDLGYQNWTNAFLDKMQIK